MAALLMWLRAFAILRQKSPAASVGKILKALSITGTPITDLRNALAKPRINIGAALNVVDRKPAATILTMTGRPILRCGGRRTTYGISSARVPVTQASNMVLPEI